VTSLLQTVAVALAILAGLLVAPRVRAEENLREALKAEQAGLDSLRERLEADQNRLEATQIAQKSTAASLERLERDIVGIRGELRDLRRRETALSRRLGATKQQMGHVAGRLQRRRQGMGHRLRRMYKQGRQGILSVFFGAESFTEALKRVRYLSRVAEQDRREYRSIRVSQRRIGEVLGLQRVQHARQQALVEATQAAESNLGARLAERARELNRLRADVVARSRAIRENQEAIALSDVRVRKLIQEIQKREQRGQRLASLPPFDFEARRSALTWPVEGEVISGFGRQQDPELRTWTFNRGVNVAAAEGMSVRSVAPGEVVLVDWYPGYGLFVLLRHPGGYYTLYGHLASIRVERGEILDEGVALGAVGSTGRLDGKPQLHFEIMQGEEPLDPEEWLAP